MGKSNEGSKINIPFIYYHSVTTKLYNIPMIWTCCCCLWNSIWGAFYWSIKNTFGRWSIMEWRKSMVWISKHLMYFHLYNINIHQVSMHRLLCSQHGIRMDWQWLNPWLQYWNIAIMPKTYRQVSNISRTESQKINDSRLGLQLSLRNILKPGVKPRIKM